VQSLLNPLAQQLGLTEEEFESQGGGIIWGLVAGIVVADVLLDMRRFGIRL
jgi:hypothetical protein